MVIDDDQRLVQAAQAGDRSSLDALLRRHYDRISSICRRIAGNAADGDDATQEALLAIVRGLDNFDGRSKFSTWSYRVATNACLDELRRRKRRPIPASNDDQAGWLAHNEADDMPSFDERLAQRDALQRALDQLPIEFRAPVLLRDQAGLDYAEIAQTLDIPPGTVRSRIARGRSKLAELVIAGNQHMIDERQNPLP